MTLTVRRSRAVREALRASRAVVALESSVFAQGLPAPDNRVAAERMLGAVKSAGATPAITAVVKGSVVVGVEGADLERFFTPGNVGKLSARDLPAAIAAGRDGATTVAAAIAIAACARIEVFATGGIGGVHLDAPFDESADLVELARTPVVVVCSGAKAILDVRSTLERLETLGVPVLGFGTNEMPAFYTARTGLRLSERVDSVEQVVSVARAQRALGRSQSVLVVQPPPREAALEQGEVETAVRRALAEAKAAGIEGAAVTPWLLSAVDRATGGRSRRANLALLESNAALAGAIAVALRGG